jgi:glycosyltransferase involved in cell wall biosynthesis
MGSAALRWARQRRIPAVCSHHTRWSSYLDYYPSLPFRYLLHRLSWWHLRRFHSQCAVTLPPSLAVKSELEAHGLRRVVVWPRGVDTALFSPSKRRGKGEMVWPRGVDTALFSPSKRRGKEEVGGRVLAPWRRRRLPRWLVGRGEAVAGANGKATADENSVAAEQNRTAAGQKGIAPAMDQNNAKEDEHVWAGRAHVGWAWADENGTAEAWHSARNSTGAALPRAQNGTGAAWVEGPEGWGTCGPRHAPPVRGLSGFVLARGGGSRAGLGWSAADARFFLAGGAGTRTGMDLSGSSRNAVPSSVEEAARADGWFECPDLCGLAHNARGGSSGAVETREGVTAVDSNAGGAAASNGGRGAAVDTAGGDSSQEGGLRLANSADDTARGASAVDTGGGCRAVDDTGGGGVAVDDTVGEDPVADTAGGVPVVLLVARLRWEKGLADFAAVIHAAEAGMGGDTGGRHMGGGDTGAGGDAGGGDTGGEGRGEEGRGPEGPRRGEGRVAAAARVGEAAGAMAAPRRYSRSGDPGRHPSHSPPPQPPPPSRAPPQRFHLSSPRRYPPFRTVVVGDGPARAAFQKMLPQVREAYARSSMHTLPLFALKQHVGLGSFAPRLPCQCTLPPLGIAVRHLCGPCAPAAPPCRPQ